MAFAMPDKLHVAIIGAGITGVNLALGLQARNISYTIYERASGFKEIGAGIGFSPNAEQAMGKLSPELLAAFKRIANPNGEDYFQWVNGYESGELMFKLHVGKDGFQGGRRGDILDEWAKLIPASAVHFGKELIDITDFRNITYEQVHLRFKDGTTAHADVVIGCDGIHSPVRELVLIPDAPAPDAPFRLPDPAYPSYTGKFCYRALAPMSAAIAAVGEDRAKTRFMYNGPSAHVITYPVANNTLLNILAVISDPNSVWPQPHTQGRQTIPGSKAEAVQTFAAWHPVVRSIIDLLPEEMDKWGIFDLAEHEAWAYTKERACIAGDAAHAMGPHLGAGAGMGVEDALVLAELLARVDRGVKERTQWKYEFIRAALDIYSHVRMQRTQDVVKATRAACDLFQWQNVAGRDPETFGSKISELFHKVWDFDVDDMVKDSLMRLDHAAEACRTFF